MSDLNSSFFVQQDNSTFRRESLLSVIPSSLNCVDEHLGILKAVACNLILILKKDAMKNLNTYYWISVGLVLFFFLPGSIMNILKTPDWVRVFNDLGYPEYLLPFLGIAKLSGCIVVALPYFKRLKEWAYAGLFFDLLGATYSALMVNGFDPKMSIMFVAIASVLASNWLWHKKSGMAG